LKKVMSDEAFEGGIAALEKLVDKINHLSPS
jgi:hypothetical protein